jgi:small nuclear ribonucleoprotein (snRNP)-like protein
VQPIHPITEKTCRSLYGKPVLIYLNDGSEIYGVLSRFEKNTLILNDDASPKLSSAKKKIKNNDAKTKAAKTKQTKSQPAIADQVSEGYSFFGLPLFGGPAPGYPGAINIPLSSIAAMFGE